MTLDEQRMARLVPRAVQRRCRWDRADIPRRDALSSYTQGALALTYPLASGLEAEPISTALTIVQDTLERPSAVPDPEIWAGRFLQAVVEVVSSDRPLTQLVRWTNPRVLGDISRRRQVAAAHRSPHQARTGRQQVATVHISRPSLLVAEVAARVTMGPRSRALAARLDFHRERWFCTALDFV
jgi:hypothetical protein